MKKLIILLMLTVPMALSAQQTAFGHLYDKCIGQEGFTTMEISPALLKMMGGENSDFLKNVKSLRFIIDDKKSPVFAKQLQQVTKEHGYICLTKINDSGTSIGFYYKEDKKSNAGGIKEFMMIVTGDDNIAFQLLGENIDMTAISDMSSIKIKGLDKLNKMDNKKK